MHRDILIDLVSLADELAQEFPVFASLLASTIAEELPSDRAERLMLLLELARDLNYASPGVAEFILAQLSRDS